MTYRPIVRFGDPVLTTPTEPVTSFGQDTRKLVRDLLDTVDAPGHAGVAATQIGVSQRVFSYNVEGTIGYLINPSIVELSEDTQDGEEGCLSIPGLYFPTVRAQHAVARGVDLDNEPVTLEGSGLMARCLQHEIDHLDGMLYVSRLERELRRTAMRQIRQSEWFLPDQEPVKGGLPSAFGG
ncbi:peptide deformylase [Spiractinospora alimapuensis]|uniref:peptide deformylase n=1 Tax=Spiractinospora alimapuensis TaxID=2820884 RepID=UPI001EEC5DAA|nr:peptide deformylase [Spiractinospora alimapuensis]QVQ54279.1 peptide deformylase [Spiractinospora alimapuensis]